MVANFDLLGIAFKWKVIKKKRNLMQWNFNEFFFMENC